MTIGEVAELVLKRYYGGQVRSDNDITISQVAMHLTTIRNSLIGEALRRSKGLNLTMDDSMFSRRKLIPTHDEDNGWHVTLPYPYMDAPDLISVVLRPASRYIAVPETWIDGNHRLLNLEGNIPYCITPENKIRFVNKPPDVVKVDVVECYTPDMPPDEPFRIPSDLEAQAIEMAVMTLENARVYIDKTNDGADAA